MKKFSKILGIVCLVFFVNIFYWLNTHFALAINLDSYNYDYGSPIMYSDSGSNYPQSCTLIYADSDLMHPVYFSLTNQSENYNLIGLFGTIPAGHYYIKDDSNYNCNINVTYNPSGYTRGEFNISPPPPPPIKYLTIAPASTSDLMASTGQVVTDIWAIIALAMGVPVSFFAIKRLISVVKR